MKKREVSIVLFITMLSVFFNIGICYSQSGSDKSRPPIPLPIQSPEVSSLFKFSAPGLNLYKGQASITVPIYTIKLKDQAIPISLQYTASGVKPNQQPGWLGTNWALTAGGSIQLEVKGTKDYNTEYYPLDPSQVYPQDKYFDRNQECNDMSGHLDLTKDQYSFSFNGLSGKIYFDRDNKIYCSNPELKIEIGDGALVEKTFTKDIGIMFGYNPNIFKITTRDGTMYFFGGNYKDRMKYPEGDASAISWLLYKIVTPSNEHVKFDYTLNESTNSNIVIGMNAYYTQFPDVESSSVLLSDCDTILNGSLYTVLSHDDIGGIIGSRKWGYSIAVAKTWKKTHTIYDPIDLINDNQVFLIPNINNWYETSTPMESVLGYYTIKSISTDYETVEFNESNSETGQFFPVMDQLSHHYFISNPTHGEDVQPTLHEIKIYDKINNPNSCFKRFELSYNSYALDSVREFDGSGNSLEPYTFTYYPGGVTMLMDITSAIDHWGFYNGMDQRPNNQSSIIPVYENSFCQREPLEIALKKTRITGETNAQIDTLIKHYLLAGTLQKVTYPTKGYTTFDYESNDFSAMVYKSQNVNEPNTVYDLNEGNLPAGGIRVKKITDVANSGISTVKEYKYVKDYLKSNSVAGPNNYTLNLEKKSSGILSGYVNYYMMFRNSLGDGRLDFAATSSSCMGGDYIGYSEVAEIVNGTDVTIHKFTDFETNPDVNPEQTATFTTTASEDGYSSGPIIRLNSFDNLVLKQNSQVSHQHERGKEWNTRKFKNNQGWYSLAEENEFTYGYNELLEDPISMSAVETNVFDIFSNKFTNVENTYIPPASIFTEDWAAAYEYKADNAYEKWLDENNNEQSSRVYIHNHYIMVNKIKYIFGDYIKKWENTKTFPSPNSSEYIETINNYEYSKYSQLIQHEITNSNKVSSIDIVSYPESETINPNDLWQNAMLKKHMIGIPFTKENSKWLDYSFIVNSEQKTEFRETNNLGFPLPSKSFEFRSPDGSRQNGRSDSVMVFDKYSSNGNLLQYHKVGDINNAFIWSEDKSANALVEHNYNEYSPTDGMFGDAGDKVLNTGGYLTLDGSHPFWNPATFLLPTYFKTGEQGTKFTVSLKYHYQKDEAYRFRPEEFTIFLGFSDLSISDIIRNSYPGTETFGRPSDLDTWEFYKESTVPAGKPWTTIDTVITLDNYNYCNKYLYIYVSCKKYYDSNDKEYEWARLYIDNLKITQEGAQSSGKNNNGRYLLAKVENAKYKDITYDISEVGEIKLNSINVNTPGALITKYTYDPAFGIKSVIDPNGKTTHYEYDPFGRLKLIKDDQGKILKKYDYHYSTTNP